VSLTPGCWAVKSAMILLNADVSDAAAKMLAEPRREGVPEADAVGVGGVEVVALPQAAASIAKQATARQQTNFAPKRPDMVTFGARLLEAGVESGGSRLRPFGGCGLPGHGLLQRGLPIVRALSEALPQPDEEPPPRGLPLVLGA